MEQAETVCHVNASALYKPDFFPQPTKMCKIYNMALILKSLESPALEDERLPQLRNNMAGIASHWEPPCEPAHHCYFRFQDKLLPREKHHHHDTKVLVTPAQVAQHNGSF